MFTVVFFVVWLGLRSHNSRRGDETRQADFRAGVWAALIAAGIVYGFMLFSGRFGMAG